MRVVKIALLVGAMIFGWAYGGAFLYSGEGDAPGVEESVTRGGNDVASTTDLVGRIFIYLALLAAVGFVVLRFFKQGKFMSGIMKKSGNLKVCETHVLGNKQFLVIVDYEGQKILLGVGPGMINKLCYLNGTPEEKLVEEGGI